MKRKRGFFYEGEKMGEDGRGFYERWIFYGGWGNGDSEDEAKGKMR